jgi:hypothetical protein
MSKDLNPPRPLPTAGTERGPNSTFYPERVERPWRGYAPDPLRSLDDHAWFTKRPNSALRVRRALMREVGQLPEHLAWLRALPCFTLARRDGGGALVFVRPEAADDVEAGGADGLAARATDVVDVREFRRHEEAA